MTVLDGRTARVSWATSPAVRASMISNGPRGTSSEVALIRALRLRGVRGRTNLAIRVEPRPIVADIVFRRRRLAVFVHGCFWHACPRHATWPKRNGKWWREKLEANRARDVRQRRRLRAAGWSVMTVWAHEPPDRAAERILVRHWDL